MATNLFDQSVIDGRYALEVENGGQKSRKQIADIFMNRPDRQANLLAPVETQCDWLREIGYEQVDCYFRIYELAVFAGRRPAETIANQNGRVGNSMAQFTTLTSRMVPLPVENVDTDQIIPARFLKAIDKNGMGQALFADWRYNADGTPKPEFVLNDPSYQGAQILLAGDNFGCGSSREHAPWALTGYGFRAVISTSFADIFRNNALKNNLLPITVDPATLRSLFDLVAEAPAS